MSSKSRLSRIFLWSSLLISFSMPFCGLAAQESPVSVKAQVNKAKLTIGDPVEYTVTLRHKSDIPVISHLEAPAGDLFKIIKIEDINQQDGNMQVEGKKYTLTAYRLGEFVLDPVSVEYKDSKGEVKTISTEPVYLNISSVAEGENKTDIRGIKSVFSMPASRLLLHILIGLGVAAGLFLGARFYWLRKMHALSQPSEPALGPEDQALNLLTALFESELLKRGKIKDYFLKLSEILRFYFERRLQVPAIEATTTEIMKLLKGKELPLEIRTQINEVLDAADLAKFAKWKPEPAQIIDINQKSKRIIEICRPKMEEPVRDV